MKKIIFVTCFLTFFFQSWSQKKIIDHSVYNQWKSISETQISSNGDYSSYCIKPYKGDGYLYIVNNRTGKTDSIPRGENAKFAGDNSYIAFQIKPGFDTLRKLELKKIKKEKWVKDSLGIFYFSDQQLKKYPNVKSFEVDAKSDLLVFLSETNNPTTQEKLRGKAKKTASETSSKGTVLTLLQHGKLVQEIKNVTELYWDKHTHNFAYNTQTTYKKKNSVYFHYATKSDLKHFKNDYSFNKITKVAWNKEASEFLIVGSTDTTKVKNYELFHCNTNNHQWNPLVTKEQKNIDSTLQVSEHFTPYFSHRNDGYYFGLAKKSVKEPKDTLLENEKVKLDIWSWTDPLIQPQQLVRVKNDLKKSIFAFYDQASKTVINLGDDTLKITTSTKKTNQYLAKSDKSYESEYSWNYPFQADYYAIDAKTGTKQPIGKAIIHLAEISPSGNFFVYYDKKDSAIKIKNILTSDEKCITCNTSENWWEDLNGMPYAAAPLGVIGFNRDESICYLKSEFDVWSYHIATATLTNATNGFGKQHKIELSIEFFESDSSYIESASNYLKGFNQLTKAVTFYDIKKIDSTIEFNEFIHADAKLTGLKKASKTTDYLVQKATAIEYPDVYLGNINSIQSFTKISTSNPQQSQYNWTTVELIKWKAYDGTSLEGLLYKPEDFDSTKKYPLLVYFYELYNKDLHSHYTPRPTASIIFPTEYASAGYIVFIPDIRYKPGTPAKDAYNCIMSGTDYVLRYIPQIDSTRMGLQGQSWGGYQTAQLITMTNRYKAAMAGAPVANMFSAYGGIRWGSGMNRQFQYERTQSRIGSTIWEAPEKYIENSPLFHLPKVKTPLLIMHNDEDGAVPWYQGIELFMGLKRLNQPTWLLNYNGDDHNLMKKPNRMDLSIRMRQFFDFYLQDKPQPDWMKYGVKAIDKGIKTGL